MLVVLYGPSCVGKTSIQKGVIEIIDGLQAVRCFQTRKPRDSDVGRVYVCRKEYDDLLKSEAIAISNQHFGDQFGTSKVDLEASLSEKKLFTLDFLIKDRALLTPYNQKKILIVPDSLDQIIFQMEMADRSSRREQIIDDYKKHYGAENLNKLKREGFYFLKNSHAGIDHAVEELSELCKYMVANPEQRKL